MKNLVCFFAVIMFFYSTNVAYSQQKKANISFNETSHDFGSVKEDGGKITHIFKFKNIGGDTLKLLNVKADCGCTIPDWTKEDIAPGKSGFVSATFDPLKRVGDFKKTVSVTTNSENPTIMLTITGKVLAREKTIPEIYTQKIDSLRLKTNHIAFTNIKNTQVKTDTIEVINTAPFDLKVTFIGAPAHITIKAVPETLKPNQKGYIIATYDATKARDWGFVSQRIPIAFNDKQNANNAITISAVIEEDFSKLTEKDLKIAPVIVFDNMTYNFDTITSGDIKEHEFTFKNTGKSDLIIRKVKASCGCTATKPSQDTIKPGKSASIKTTFNSNGKHGNENKTVSVISNDPKNNNITLKITGFIKDKPVQNNNQNNTNNQQNKATNLNNNTQQNNNNQQNNNQNNKKK